MDVSYNVFAFENIYYWFTVAAKVVAIVISVAAAIITGASLLWIMRRLRKHRIFPVNIGNQRVFKVRFEVKQSFITITCNKDAICFKAREGKFVFCTARWIYHGQNGFWSCQVYKDGRSGGGTIIRQYLLCMNRFEVLNGKKKGINISVF